MTSENSFEELADEHERRVVGDAKHEQMKQVRQNKPVYLTFTLEGAIGVWASSRSLNVTKKDVVELAEALRLLHAKDPEFMPCGFR